MRAFTRRAWASLVFSAALLVTASAHADELLVMPYACSMVGGRPLLTRAPEQSHRIVGGREQRTHTACSPVNPDMCRTWTVHRFTLDCDGARVPWVSIVAAAAEETTRRAWIEDGRLVLRMPPSWSYEPGDPCARPSGFDDRFGFGRMRRYCADRRAMSPPPIVEMPAGFAPMLGIDGIFVRSGPDPRPAQDSGPVSSPLPPINAAPAPPPKVARAEPQPREEMPSAPPIKAEQSPETTTKSTPAPKVAPPKVAAQSPPPPEASPPPPKPLPVPSQAASPPTTTPGGPVIPKIINRPEAATTDVAEVAKSEAPKTEAKAPNGPPAAPKESQTVPPASQSGDRTSRAREDATISVNLLSVVRSPTAGIAVFGVIALALLAAFALARRRERLTGPRTHDLASVSLGQGRRGQLVPRPPQAGIRPVAAPVAPRPTPPPSTPPAWVDRIPQTRAEALQMLGMGVSQDATEMAMKKIVDGLRLSWHPDLARDEPDRELREFRLKQINAAWDLIQGKRLERLDS